MLQRLTVFAIAAALVLALPSGAEAKGRRTALRKSPENKSPVVARVPASRALSIDEHRGDWVRVSQGKRTGWVKLSSVKNVKLPRKIRLRRSARAKSRANARVQKNKSVTVLSRKGDWLQVRYRGHKGWVAVADLAAESAAVAGAQEPATPEPTPEKLEKLDPSTWKVTFKTALRQQPGESSKAIAQLPVGARVKVLGRKGRWLRAKHGRTLGWIVQTTAEPPANEAPENKPADDQRPARWGAGTVAVDGSVKAVERQAPPRKTHDATANRPEPLGPDHTRTYLGSGFAVRSSVGLGVSSVGFDFTSDGQTELSEYRVSADTAAISGAVDVSSPIVGPLFVAADARYSLSLGVPGIRYHMTDGESSAVSFSVQNIDLGMRIGGQLPTRRPIQVYARGGWHFTWFHVGEIVNAGRLGRESLRGFTAGLGVEAAIGANLIARTGADVLLSGRRKQTPGLEDGERHDVFAAWFNLGAGYLATKTLAIEGRYRFGWSETNWTGQSIRQADVMNAVRTDRAHELVVTLSKSIR